MPSAWCNDNKLLTYRIRDHYLVFSLSHSLAHSLDCHLYPAQNALLVDFGLHRVSARSRRVGPDNYDDISNFFLITAQWPALHTGRPESIQYGDTPRTTPEKRGASLS